MVYVEGLIIDQDKYPGKTIIDIEGGFLIFDTVEEYEDWKM